MSSTSLESLLERDGYPRLNRPKVIAQLIPKVNALAYMIQVPKSVRYHRQGRYVWALTQFQNKDFVTLGHETFSGAQKQALFYCQWFEVQKWIPVDQGEPD